MPRLRWCGGTNTLAGTLTTGRSPMVIRPSSGFSRPATQRSVVVLPQPEGPSSVTISPAATSKSMLATAVTTSLLALKVLVSPSTRIMVQQPPTPPYSILLLHPKSATELERDEAQCHQQQEHQYPEGAEQQERAFLPEIENDHGGGAVLRAGQHERDGELAIGVHHHPEPGGEQAGPQQRQRHFEEVARPGDAGDLRGLIELVVDLHHRGRYEPQRDRHVFGEISKPDDDERADDRQRH